MNRILEEGWRVTDAATAAGLSKRRAYEWLRRFRAGRASALKDQRSTPARSPHAVPAVTLAEIERLRRERLTGEAIARQLGLGRLSALDPKPPMIRYPASSSTSTPKSSVASPGPVTA